MRIPRTILAALAALAVGMITGPAAHASIIYGPIGQLGAGEEHASSPVGVTINQSTGEVFVGYLLEGGVHAYRRSGSHFATFDERNVSGVAVDPVNGNVYVVKAAEGVGTAQQIETYRFEVFYQQRFAFSIAGSANVFGAFTVVQIASDSAGNVYLPNAPNNEVQKFSPEGSLLQTITGAGGDALKEPTGVAVDSAGNVYVADSGNGRVEEFSSSGAFVMAIGTGVDQTTKGNVCTAASKDTCGPGSDGSQAVAVDAGGNIFVGENGVSGFHVVLYSPTGEQLSDFGLGAIGTALFGVGNTLAVSPTGLVYVTDGGNNTVWIYAPQSKPSLSNESSSAVAQTSATLNATIDPGHSETTYRFEYGTSAAYGANVPVSDASIGNGGTEGNPVVVGQLLKGLQPAATYHYRVVATNALGQTVGADQTFTTPPPQPPVVSTGLASGVAQNTAVLTGSVDTEGFETGYEFDLGVDTSYGTRIFGDAGSVPGGNTFTVPLQGLTPGTTYHYRILATNAFGTVYGVDQTFTTTSYPSSTLANTGAPPLLPTPLLAPAGGTPVGGATASSAGAESTAHEAVHRKAGRARSSSHERKGRGAGRASHTHRADRRSK